MQLTKNAIYAATLLATIAAAVPSPAAGAEKFFLSNGEKSVMVEIEPSAANTANVFQALAEGDIDCKGSAFCERLGSSCDAARRKVIPSNTYTTSLGSADTGTCSGTCGLFVSGENCQASGEDLINAYNDIRSKGHCTHCGRKQMARGCMIKIDRVTGC
ncbi:hypothetical protein ANOM_000906 [Aspergillus nomiae NRRL 13137]|uniref:Uncharacterized protein n=1 Tax=Aspergillus nomiae NRRL (strain ATCC 15546 / NRRL 13137 / CBS 260.88 / M93) TaxID=1509407 RepID=A0A0L1JGD5_ASPN3|nr:uncharacterized protein ANOM_000906 [Aspergillus nomiae NRRL 13137]KNG90772.1 hypothetical protein ANOM_000906 [Aspergillus nomiae NRRL 13137]